MSYSDQLPPKEYTWHCYYYHSRWDYAGWSVQVQSRWTLMEGLLQPDGLTAKDFGTTTACFEDPNAQKDREALSSVLAAFTTVMKLWDEIDATKAYDKLTPLEKILVDTLSIEQLDRYPWAEKGVLELRKDTAKEFEKTGRAVDSRTSWRQEMTWRA